MQSALDKSRSSSTLRDVETVYLTAYAQALLDEERFLKQKSKIESLCVRDSNFAYFHRSVKARVSRSRIDCVIGDNNIMYQGNMISTIFVSHYRNFIRVDSY